MNTMSRPTPILIIVFNRPEKTARLVERLLMLEPREILVAADGPRHQQEKHRTDAVRNIVSRLSEVHNVKTKYSTRNLGCGLNVSEAIKWGFGLHDRLIIVEDDIEITDVFIDFCELGLAKYEQDSSVLCISSGPLIPLPRGEFGATFLTRYPNIWGWAAWRRSFDGFSLDLQGQGLRAIWAEIKKTFPESTSLRVYFFLLMLLVKSRRIDTWDFQFYYLGWTKRALALTPGINLSENIGFDEEATHTKRVPSLLATLPVELGRAEEMLENSPAHSAKYERLVEEKLWRIGPYVSLRLLIKLLITRSRRYVASQ